MLAIRNLLRTGIALVVAAFAMSGLMATGAAATTAAQPRAEVCPSGYVCLYGDFSLVPYAQYNRPGAYNLNPQVNETRIVNNLTVGSLFACTGLSGSGVCTGPLPSGPYPGQTTLVRSIRITR